MQKRLISILLIFFILIPNTAFAAETTPPTENIQLQEEPAESQSTDIQEPAAPETPDVPPEEPSNPDTPEIPDEPEEPSTTEELQESIIENFAVENTDVDTCVFTWSPKKRVTGRYVYGDTENTFVISSGRYEVRNIPVGEEVTLTLTTDELHKPVSLSSKPSDEFMPASIQQPKRKCISRQKSMSWYCSDLEVFAKNGKIISYKDYTISGEPVTKAGYYDVNISFKNKYAQYKPLKTSIEIYPQKPSLGYNPNNPKLNSLILSATDWEGEGDTIIVQTSTNSNFAKPVTLTKAINKGPVTIRIDGLKQNTTYYIRARLKKTIGKRAVYSEYAVATLYTAKPMSAYSPNHPDVKRIISQMKNNKKFTYTFNGRYSARDMYDFLDKLDSDYSQYAYRYYRDTDFSNGKVKVIYSPNTKKMTKYTKSTKVIDSIVKKARKKKGTRAKIKYVNTRLCKLCRYDYDTYRETKKANMDAYNLYGCLVRHKAVCAGYAEAFHLIMIQLGIPDVYQHGKNHVWNKVKIGKKWYHVDVTWNDTCGRRTRYLLKKSHR